MIVKPSPYGEGFLKRCWNILPVMSEYGILKKKKRKGWMIYADPGQKGIH
jgi:hypothetical protein